MKFICIGRNYADYAAGIHRQLPDEPVFSVKPESAITRCNRPFFLPDFSKRVEYEIEILVKIDRLGKFIQEKFAPLYYNEIGLGINFTARDLQEACIEQGRPWDMAMAFDGSAAVGRFVPKSQFPDLKNLRFHLLLNGQTVQRANTCEMLFPIDKLIACVSRFVTLKTGDILFTGSPAGVGPVHINDRLQGFLEDEKLFDFYIK